jgi:hypothetical protein
MASRAREPQQRRVEVAGEENLPWFHRLPPNAPSCIGVGPARGRAIRFFGAGRARYHLPAGRSHKDFCRREAGASAGGRRASSRQRPVGQVAQRPVGAVWWREDGRGYERRARGCHGASVLQEVEEAEVTQEEGRRDARQDVQEVEHGAPEGLVPGSSLIDGRVPARQTFTVADAEGFIAEVRWQFATTMPQWPHWYTVRDWRPDLEAEFEAFARLIRRFGVVAPWPRDSANPRYHNAYLVVGAWMYWTMPGTIAEHGVINRAEPDLPPDVMREADR